MSLELVHSKVGPDVARRLFRVRADIAALKLLTPLQARALYDDLEKARDALSRILDHADGKHA